MKSSSSIQNIILLLLFVIGLFVLYRYVKTVESETKMLQNHVIELTEKIQTLSMKSNKQKKHLPNQPPTHHMAPTESQKQNVDDDKASIQSEDITNMLRRVMGDDIQEEDRIIDEIVLNVNNDMCTPETCVKIEEIEEIEEIEKDVIDDDISITPPPDTKSILMKKTNDELKNILKTQSLSTKGSKSELVERIMSQNNE